MRFCVLTFIFINALFHSANLNNNKKVKFILYNVNNLEGFNLKRDVYCRMANIVKIILDRISEKFQLYLILPSWNNTAHWNRQKTYRWSGLFDANQMNQYVQVFEFDDLIDSNSKLNIDLAIYLINDKSLLDQNEIDDYQEECSDVDLNFYMNVVLNKLKIGLNKNGRFECFDRIATQTSMINLLERHLEIYDYIFIDNAEKIVSEFYGNQEFWNCRKSMQYNKNFISESNKFILKNIALKFNFQTRMKSFDNLIINPTLSHQSSLNYLAVHIRLGDFLTLRNTSISFQDISNTIKSKLIELNCSIVFIATDGTSKQISTLTSILQPHHIILYNKNHDDGKTIIIEQLICSQASYFIGTLTSTFTMRIQEDRNLIGYDQSTTYNYFIT